MRNNNKKVLLFTTLSFFLLLTESYFSSQLSSCWPLFSKIDILSDIKSSDIFAQKSSSTTLLSAKPSRVPDSLTASKDNSESSSFSQYLLPGIIVNFKADTTQPVLPKMMTKLAALNSGEKIKLRIAWFGDSIIESDLITQTVRELMQNKFSGTHGVGFVPFRSITAGYRTSATARSSGSWVDDNFKKRLFQDPLFFSGHVYFSDNGKLSLKDNTIKDSSQIVEKWLLCGPVDSTALVTVNNSMRSITAHSLFNRVLLDKTTDTSIEFRVPVKRMALYGLSLEPEYGVIIDNFSFRGICGSELGKFDAAFLDELSQSGTYDLIIIQYGVNVMSRPLDKNYDYYLHGMSPVLKKLRQHLPNTEFLMISCFDRAFPYGQKWKSAVGLDSLLKIQATLAYNNNIPFFNLYQTMGGNGTIVKWVEGGERLAAQDYIHPSPKGAVILGQHLYRALMNDYQRLSRKPVY